MKPFDRAGPALLERRWKLLKVSTQREIGASPEKVWDVMSDHTTWTSWHEDYDEHEALTEQTTGIGARFKTKEWVLRSESEVVRWEPGVVIGLTVLQSRGLRWLLSSYYSEVAIEPIANNHGSCRVRYSAAFVGTRTFWLLAAYTVGHSLGSIYLDARSSLKRLDRYVSEAPGSTL